MSARRGWLATELEHRGVSRREFVGFCATMAAALALPDAAAAQIARAIQRAEKPILIWLEFQDCAGNTESFLRASRPTAAEVILDVLSIDYHETIMAAAGVQSRENRDRPVTERPGGYIAVVEGSIPTGANGAYCTIGGESAIDIARKVCGNAAATIAIGTCATYGGLPAASPNPTGALGVADAVPGVRNLINLSACPANVENLTALLVHYLTFKAWPPLDHYRRPLFAYGKSIHDNCERRAHFEAGRFVERFGTKEEELGYCLYKVGCKGPETYANCSKMRYNDRVSWCIGAGAPCIGCAEPYWVDKFANFYDRLPGVKVPGIEGIEAGADTIGIVAGAATAVGIAAHAIATAAKGRFKGEKEEESKEVRP